MKINSRQKGAAGERELIKILQKHIDIIGFDIKLERNLEQTRKSGADIVIKNIIAIEVKRCEKLQIDAWWFKLKNLCQGSTKPVLAFRRNREAWRFKIDNCDCFLNLKDFLLYFSDVLAKGDLQ